MAKLTTPLKSWTDDQGRTMHRLGDLPVGIKFKMADNGPDFEVVSYSRSSRTGKRQVKNINTTKVIYEYCSKKVYIIE